MPFAVLIIPDAIISAIDCLTTASSTGSFGLTTVKRAVFQKGHGS
ncbi:hypothetical protein J2S10_002933 [Neobacillus ginsengisoli]|uniref:Uncharacterized protein n=1 Tax=Neobacillus ginsengisoli TaxID=904295 RepID=A0ABT9XW80_9BACI|nr:hypothetical protein [Neobacillus ginsengisoli]